MEKKIFYGQWKSNLDSFLWSPLIPVMKMVSILRDSELQAASPRPSCNAFPVEKLVKQLHNLRSITTLIDSLYLGLVLRNYSPKEMLICVGHTAESSICKAH